MHALLFSVILPSTSRAQQNNVPPPITHLVNGQFIRIFPCDGITCSDLPSTQVLNLPVPGDCTRFRFCVDDQLQEEECPPGFLFSYVAARCVPEAQASCYPSCLEEEAETESEADSSTSDSEDVTSSSTPTTTTVSPTATTVAIATTTTSQQIGWEFPDYPPASTPSTTVPSDVPSTSRE